MVSEYDLEEQMKSKEYNVLIGVLLLVAIASGVIVGTINYANGYYSGYNKRIDEERVKEWCKELGEIKRDIGGHYIDSGLCRTIHNDS